MLQSFAQILLKGVSKAIQKYFRFVNIMIGVYHDVIDVCMMTEYSDEQVEGTFQS